MMFLLRFRARRPAVTRVCQACEAQREALRARGVARWDRYAALCFVCQGRHAARLPQVATAGIPASACVSRDKQSAVA